MVASSTFSGGGGGGGGGAIGNSNALEDYISTFVTYKYVRLRNPHWLGYSHFVLRIVLLIGYVFFYEILFKSSHLKYERPIHQPIPLWLQRPDVLDVNLMSYCFDGGPPCREWNIVDDEHNNGKPVRKESLFITTQWVESHQERRTKNCAKRKGFTGELEENLSTNTNNDDERDRRENNNNNNNNSSSSSTTNLIMKDFHTSGNLGRGGRLARGDHQLQPECGSWEEVEREIFRVSGAEQFAIHVKPEYVATSWSVHAGFLQVTLPNKKIFRPNFLSETPKDVVIKVGDIVKNVELYPNELKKKELSVIVKGLQEKGLEYLLEADELYEYDGKTQTLRQNGLTLALELTYSNTSPFDVFKALAGQGSENFPWHCQMDVRLVGYTEVRAQEYVFKNWPAERINLQRAGIHLIVYQKGKLGRFDLGALVLVFITGGGLMTAARMFIELMSTTFGPEAARHRRALTDDVDLAHLD